MSQLIKLTDANTDKAVYLKIEAISSIRESFKNPSNTSNGNNFNGTLGNGINSTFVTYNYDEPGNTTILIGNNHNYFVSEHITEVIALLEGRDPRPAKVLYGSKNS